MYTTCYPVMKTSSDFGFSIGINSNLFSSNDTKKRKDNFRVNKRVSETKKVVIILALEFSSFVTNVPA